MEHVTASPTNRLAECVLGLRYERLPADAVDHAKRLLLDFLAVACGGRVLVESSAPILATVRELNGSAEGLASAIGVSTGFLPQYAALLNATFGHSMDFDDTHCPSHSHPGSPIFATLLAIAEAHRLSGKAFITAAVGAYEAFGRIGRAHDYQVHARGFHPTATTGVFGATAGAAHLLRFSVRDLLNGWGINLSQAAGTLQYLENGAWTKRVHTGLAAHHAILAATLARHGVVGAAEPLDGRFGYFRCYSSGACSLDTGLKDLGERLEILGTAIKPYPCCRCNHGVIDGVLALAREHALGPADVESMEVGICHDCIPQVAEPASTRKAPQNTVDGQFSVFFAAAVALRDKRYTWESYRHLGDPDLGDLMQRIQCVESPVSFAALRTRRGVFRKEVPFPLGEPENPFGWEPLLEKAMPLLEVALPEAKAEAIVGMVRRLDDVADMGVLGELLRGGPSA
jgi:2-methylcitrate dehydratase PrpD